MEIERHGHVEHPWTWNWGNRKRYSGLRLKVFERDGWKCLRCGTSHEAHIAEFGVALSIDHIDGRGRHETTPNNDLSNLQTLCLRCHGRKDGLRADYSTRRSYKGEGHPSHKLTWPEVHHIRALRQTGWRISSLCELYGLSDHPIRQICKNKSWVV